MEQIVQAIQGKLHNRLVYGVGNIHGAAEPLCEWFEQMNQKAKEQFTARLESESNQPEDEQKAVQNKKMAHIVS